MFAPFVFAVRLWRRIDAYPQSLRTQSAEKNAATSISLRLCDSASGFCHFVFAGGVLLMVIGGTSSVPSDVRTDVATITQSPLFTSL
jgi:hypothetical protein